MRISEAFRVPVGAGTILPAVAILIASLGGIERAEAAPPKSGKWVSLFNGKDLTGWTPKIRGQELGDDPAQTFRVEDGLIKVSYDKYKTFDGQFGHLFYKDKFSNYRLRIEYRFVGDQCPGGPGWAVRNSGVMIHGEDPLNMAKNQDFPVSIEVQFLGGDGKKKRPTANVCTPGTNIVMGGKLITKHCTDSTAKTYDGDQWVTVEVEVNGEGTIRHIVEGKTVLEYEDPQLDPEDKDGARLIKNGEILLHEGTISLQSESHPIEFRKVEIMLLAP